MARRNTGIVGLVAITIFCIFLIALNQKETSSYRKIIRYQPYDLYGSFRSNSVVPEPLPVLPSISEVVQMQKDLIKEELTDYQFPAGKKLEDYTLSNGGQPLRTVIVTTWRSGSTFLGDVLNAVPGNFYHYEPLLDYGIVQIRGPPESISALKTLKRLLNCDYSQLYNYLDYGMSHVYLFTHNTRLWNNCEMFKQYCWNTTFLNDICKVFPFQSLKTVRLRLWLAEELLKDQQLNVKVVLLVRDPRGTLQSRKHRDWCPGEPDCDQASNLCADMVADYKAANNLIKKYPKTFRAIRYEDLSLNPYEYVRDLFDFIGLYYHNDVKQFLDSHTKMNVGGVSSTFRDSKSAPFHWRTEMNLTEIQDIEEQCDLAMQLWGYLRTENEVDLKDFNPLTTYTLS